MAADDDEEEKDHDDGQNGRQDGSAVPRENQIARARHVHVGRTNDWPLAVRNGMKEEVKQGEQPRIVSRVMFYLVLEFSKMPTHLLSLSRRASSRRSILA